ncbi:MAG TPA: DUF4388 domain-containing protein [Candidatus Polarisedimenticolia bacterium]|nr:DUF4388 domain-containing protein [Candidatus Polarisedimenticolia bacterium]
MALKGTLKDFSLADIFQLIGIQKKSGVLSLKSGQETATVSFIEGQVVAADSTLRRLEDRLGAVLVKSGRLSEAQLQEALRQQRSNLKRLGTVLVEGKFLDAAHLAEALQIQIGQMVYRLFRWTSGEYDFNQDARVEYDRDLMQPMSAESVLMEGARILDEWPMIERGLRSMQAVYRHANVAIAGSRSSAAVGRGDEAAGAVTLNDQERLVHGLVDGKRTVQEVVERSPLAEFETCRTLFELIGRQLVEEVQGATPAGATQAPAAAARKGPAVKPKERATTGSPLLLGIAVLAVVLIAGGGVLVRVLPWLGKASQASDLPTWIGPFLSDQDEARVGVALGRSHVQSAASAIEVYYLLNRAYPGTLVDLVTEGLLPAESILTRYGQPIPYEASRQGYRLGDDRQD